MGKASKFGLRKAAEEKRNKHAQRTPLPPRPGQVKDAKDAIKMAEYYQSHPAEPGTFADKSAKKGKKAKRKVTTEAPSVAVEATEAHRAPQPKAEAFMSDARALGWDVDAKLEGSTVLTDVILASRGDESIQIEWQNGVFINNCLYRRPDGSTSKLRNASHARQQMALPPPTAQQMAARKRVVERTSGKSARQPVREVPFDMGLMTDEALADALRGTKIVWINQLSQGEESESIPPNAQVRVNEGFSGRQVHFNGATGARSVRIGSIIAVKGARIPRQRKGEAA